MPLSALIAAVLLALGASGVGAVRVFTALAREAEAAAPSVVLRSFETRGRPFYLVVDPRTLETRAAPAAAVAIEPRSWSDVRARIADTAYGRALVVTADDQHTAVGIGKTADPLQVFVPPGFLPFDVLGFFHRLLPRRLSEN